MAELMTLANMTGAALVEPCVRDGRLYGACQPGNYRLRDLFQIESMSDIARLVSFDEFRHYMRTTTNVTRHSICLHKLRKSCSGVLWGFRTRQSCPAMMSTANVLYINQYFRASTLGLDKGTRRLAEKSIRFADEHVSSIETSRPTHSRHVGATSATNRARNWLPRRGVYSIPVAQ